MDTSDKQISTNPPDLKIQQRAELFDLISDVADADGAVMGRANLRPLVDERLLPTPKIVFGQVNRERHHVK